MVLYGLQANEELFRYLFVAKSVANLPYYSDSRGDTSYFLQNSSNDKFLAGSGAKADSIVP